MADPQPGDGVAGDFVIRLDDFIKRSGCVGTGGEAKLRIQNGEVQVNGEVETRRRKQLAEGDVVELLGETLVVDAAALSDS